MDAHSVVRKASETFIFAWFCGVCGGGRRKEKAAQDSCLGVADRTGALLSIFVPF